MTPRRPCRLPVRTALVAALAGAHALAIAAPLQTAGLPPDLTELSLDDLMHIEVVTVSRQAEPMVRAAAAIYVLTGEEIERSGARNLAEALRLVPGLQVARTNANSYRISSRGFDSSGDKMQVLVDGRSVYTPLTSSVFWDVLDTFMPDLERIEVIRGPGAAVWGANAVNGVINIVTRPASQTVGGRVQAGGGFEERAFAGVRSGTAAGDAGHIRFYAKAFERDDALRSDGAEAEDGQRHAQAGLRGDWQPAERQRLMIAGDLYAGRTRAQGRSSGAPLDNELHGGNLNSHWERELDDDGRLGVIFSYDRYERVLPETFGETRDTLDVGVQHELWLEAGPRHNLAYGAGYRYSQDHTLGPPNLLIFEPSSRSIDTLSAFVQDRMHFADGRVVWTVGSRFEHNDFTGFEFQPGTRLGWQVAQRWFTWAALSRALRTPNRLDHDIAIFCADPLDNAPTDPQPGIGCAENSIVGVGSGNFRSEELLAGEWGLRYGSTLFTVDLALFYNDYDRLRSIESRLPNFRLANELSGHGVGGELSLVWRPHASFDLRASYDYLDLEIERAEGSADVNTEHNIEGSSARHLARLRAAWQPHPRWTGSANLRYVGPLDRTATPGPSVGSTAVPAYTELGLRLAWRLRPALELALVGENLLDAQHPEFGASGSRSELQRAGWLSLQWSWP